MTGSALLTAVLDILLGAFTATGTKMGAALSNFATAIFITEGTEVGISIFGSLILIFASIALAFGLFRWVLNFLTSLGGRNR